MNPEIQRLTNLRNFFKSKREACEEEIRLQQSQIKLWTESADEVDRSIAQAEKEYLKDKSPQVMMPCPNCGKYPCLCAQVARDQNAIPTGRCPFCGCPKHPAHECHCQKTRPAIAIRCTKCGCNIGAGHEGRCADHA